MDSRHLAQTLKALLDDKKAQDILLIDLTERASIADYFLIATGTSSTHVAALAEEVDRFAWQNKLPSMGIEGLPEALWVLVDLGDVVVHVFQAEIRKLYDLERLWQHPRGSMPLAAAQLASGGAG
ncbi:MAG: ribosome silencing factor [Magnetococcus sp. WYHC-3]